MSVETFTVGTTGVGRKDYSRDVQYSTEPIIRSRQLRFFYALRGINQPSLTFPWTDEWLLRFPVNGVLQDTAPATPFILQQISGAADRNALVVLALLRYASLQDYLNYNIAAYYGISYGYGKTELTFTKGIPTIEGHVYTVYVAEWSGELFNFNLAINGLVGALEQLE